MKCVALLQLHLLMQFLLSLLLPLSSPFSTLSPLPSPPLAVTSSTVQQANIKSIMPPQMVSLRDQTRTFLEPPGSSG